MAVASGPSKVDADFRPIIYWFRRDLRTSDLPGLLAAAESGRPVIPCYIFDHQSPGDWSPGAANRWWLHHSLQQLQQALETLGAPLLIRRGPTVQVLQDLALETAAESVLCSRDYQPWSAAQEQQLHAAFNTQGVTFRRFPGVLLQEPEAVSTGQGTPYKVFTPFWRACMRQIAFDAPLRAPTSLQAHTPAPDSLQLDQLQLLPSSPDWAAHWPDLWQPGEVGAHGRLKLFLDNSLQGYAEQRDIPSVQGTSLLSAHLHCGEISPRQVLWQVRSRTAQHPAADSAADKFVAEIGWREFNHHLLYHFPHITDRPFRESFETFPWRTDDAGLRAWQRGQTGYPIVDAGMRQLWQTGYMHNRVRMVVASFLCKHLRLPWQLGARWFWDTLIDADLASNSGGWQWGAGSGADAAPYFRIFNPTLQGRKFDPQGDYVKRWVPELKHLSAKHIHLPHEAPELELRAAGITLGENYPLPLVDHREARGAALAAWRDHSQRLKVTTS